MEAPAEPPRPPTGPAHLRERDDAEIEFSRVVAFSDGVFAIAITLLVLGLTVPAGTDDLGGELRDRLDELYAYGISFAVLSSLWLSHHRFYAALARFDTRLIGLNLLYLAFIALVPWTSDLLGNYSDDVSAVVIYAAVMAVISATFVLQVRYSFSHGLLREEFEHGRGRYEGASAFTIAVLFCLSIPVAFVATAPATYFWIAIAFFGHRLADVLAGEKSPF